MKLGRNREGQEERKVSFWSTLLTSALTILAAVAIFFVINSFRPLDKHGEFEGLVSASDGKLIVSRDPDLSIDEIAFDDFDKDEIIIAIDDNPGYKLDTFSLREREGNKEIDMLRTLADDDVDISTLPEVPQEVRVQVADNSGKGKIQLYIITDRPYPSGALPAQQGVTSKKDRFVLQVGRKGLTGFLKAEAGGFYSPGTTGGVTGLGEGPVAAVVAVRTQGSRATGRSQLLIVKRKGIVNPGDIWYDPYKSGYFSIPYITGNYESSRLAFLTPLKDGGFKVVVCTFDYKQHFDISTLFPEGAVTIDHWGKTPEDYDILYVREQFGEGAVDKVKVGTLDVMRLMENLASFPPPEPAAN